MRIHATWTRPPGLRVPLAAAVAVIVAVAPLALASPAGPRVDVAIHVEREVVRTAPDGSTSVEREPVREASPGDVLVYTLAATNRGDAPALQSRLDDPIPAGTVLIPESVAPAGARVVASLDGGTSWQPFPVESVRTDAEGHERRAPVAAEAYTHLRWQLNEPLEPGGSRTFSFKVRVR